MLYCQKLNLLSTLLGPLSSVMTASVSPDLSEHPVKRWASDDANFSINTDDPTCFDNSMATELELVSEKIGLSDYQIWKCVTCLRFISFHFVVSATQCRTKLLLGGTREDEAR